MADFKIEKDVPPPPGLGGLGAPSRYPWKEMSVGDSVFFACPPHNKARVVTAASHYGKRNGCRLASRAEDGGVRVWRTE